MDDARVDRHPSFDRHPRISHTEDHRPGPSIGRSGRAESCDGHLIQNVEGFECPLEVAEERCEAGVEDRAGLDELEIDGLPRERFQ